MIQCNNIQVSTVNSECIIRNVMMTSPSMSSQVTIAGTIPTTYSYSFLQLVKRKSSHSALISRLSSLQLILVQAHLEYRRHIAKPHHLPRGLIPTNGIADISTISPLTIADLAFYHHGRLCCSLGAATTKSSGGLESPVERPVLGMVSAMCPSRPVCW